MRSAFFSVAELVIRCSRIFQHTGPRLHSRRRARGAARRERVESVNMTKDLAILIGPDQPWMTAEQFFEAIRANLERAMAEGS